ncbi:MAG: beta-L-arabinofuranosidase domain-containing protein [Terriglobales bacterium]
MRPWVKEPIVPQKVAGLCQPIAYSGQRIDPNSLLGRRLEINLNRGLLDAVDLDSYLRPYREGTRPLWPSGEYLGKFMQAYSRMYQYTGDIAILNRMNLITQTWIEAQKEDGWVGTGDRWGAWDVWEHKYTLLGLLEQYALTGNPTSLIAAKKIGDLIYNNFGPGRRDLMRTGGWAMGSGSILEPMTYLYRFSGDERYLQVCNDILRAYEGETGPKIITTLTRGSKRVYDIVDTVSQWHNGRKGYEMLSCIIGIVRMYELTGKPEYLATATNAWQDILGNRLYITGTCTTHETFREDHVLPGEAADEVGEGCVTAHWIFLNRLLFYVSGDPKYIDAIEKSLYNQLLASQCPSNAHQAYFAPLNGTRPYELQNVWGGQPPCCLSSVMRSVSRIPEVMWTKFVDDGLAILLYNQGKITDQIKTARGLLPLSLELHSGFPRTGSASVLVRPDKPAEFRLALRVPAWTTQFEARVDGRTYSGTRGNFLNISRTWQPGETIQITMDMNDHLIEGGPSYAGYYAFQHGPQVLALDGRISLAAMGEVRIKPSEGINLISRIETLPKGWIGDQAYTTSALVASERAVLVPFADAGQQGQTHAYRAWIKAQ